ncbi:hypothetical protein GCM10007874_68000 [Labrys miyagiensis]|uniref:DUF3800 domain-containing protein n=1 Tax=Labrys miyagiensis TaxID=346912 RepID=A0ABQ6CVR7_9HYPH|nr:hypothetical protein GCM10007874_68000 [Labrys miyagiensis]
MENAAPPDMLETVMVQAGGGEAGMHIYIDESGSFAATEGRSSVSTVGALIIPDANRA